MDFNRLNVEWKKEYEKIENQIELLRIHYILSKKCKCDIDECEHFEKETNNLFKEKLKRLLKAKILLGAIADFQISYQR
jgi:hypothetical protein